MPGNQGKKFYTFVRHVTKRPFFDAKPPYYMAKHDTVSKLQGPERVHLGEKKILKALVKQLNMNCW